MTIGVQLWCLVTHEINYIYISMWGTIRIFQSVFKPLSEGQDERFLISDFGWGSGMGLLGNVFRWSAIVI